MNGTNIWCEMDLSISKLMCVCITQFVIYNLQFKSNFANRADFVLYDKVLSYIKQFASNFGFKLNIKQHCLFKQCNLLNSSNRYAHHLIYIWSLTGVFTRMGRLMNWRMIYAFLISNDVLNLIYISYIKNTRFTVSLVFCINEHTLYILYTI